MVILKVLKTILIIEMLKINSCEAVFSKTYKDNLWGGERGQLYSGPGSHIISIIDPYIQIIDGLIRARGFENTRFVDLGCGDFNIGKHFIHLCHSFIGVDIVKQIVDQNNKLFANEKLKFVKLNIIKDPLPEGDVCFIRQVLQHLSNEQILQVLPKLKQYKIVFITEHLPNDNFLNEINVDKPVGANIRLDFNSGVFLDEKPFNLPRNSLQRIIEVQASHHPSAEDNGKICTFIYNP